MLRIDNQNLLQGGYNEGGWISAAALTPATTNGAVESQTETTTNKVNYDVLEFNGSTDGTADQIAWLPVVLSGWDLGTFKVRFRWQPQTGATAADLVLWQVAAVAVGNDDAIDAAPGTAATAEDSVTAVGDLHVVTSGAITAAGTPVADDVLFLKISRDYDYSGAGTGLAEKANLIAIQIQYNQTSSSSGPAAW